MENREVKMHTRSICNVNIGSAERRGASVDFRVTQFILCVLKRIGKCFKAERMKMHTRDVFGEHTLERNLRNHSELHDKIKIPRIAIAWNSQSASAYTE